MGLSRLARRIAVSWGPPLAPLVQRWLRRPVLVVGFNKSAKSMIVEALACHPRVSVFPGEGNEDLWFRGFYPWWDLDLDLAPLWYAPDAFVKAVIESRDDRFRTTRAQLALYQSIRAPANVLVNDSGMLAALLPDVMPVFPEARIIHVVRDGCAHRPMTDTIPG